MYNELCIWVKISIPKYRLSITVTIVIVIAITKRNKEIGLLYDRWIIILLYLKNSFIFRFIFRSVEYYCATWYYACVLYRSRSRYERVRVAGTVYGRSKYA